MGNLEFELGRYVAGEESGQRTITSDDGGKLKLVQPVKKESQLTPAGGSHAIYSVLQNLQTTVTATPAWAMSKI